MENPKKNIILASGVTQLKGNNNREKAITQRRLKTIVTETMWMIWKLRNKDIFEEKLLNKETWINEWGKNIEERIKLKYSTMKGSNIKNQNKTY